MDDNQIALLPESALAKARPIKRRGHAGQPGRGPDGETCKSCDYYVRQHYHAKVYRKCGLMKRHWTHGPGSDIRAGDPACQFWEAAE